MGGLKERWMTYVRNQTEKTARDPNARVKLMGWVLTLIIIGYSIPRADAGPLGCTACVTWAAGFCAPIVAAGGACAAVAPFPPLLCACLIASGGLFCALAGGSCIVVCVSPSP